LRTRTAAPCWSLSRKAKARLSRGFCHLGGSWSWLILADCVTKWLMSANGLWNCIKY
jgi:hypothetical protein